MRKTSRKLIMLFLAAALVLGACVCSLPSFLTTPTPPSPTTIPSASTVPGQTVPATPGQTLPPPANVYPPAFATYSEAAVNLPVKFNGGGYALPVDLSQVQSMDLVKLTASQKALLAKNGFVVTPPVPGEFREFYQIYEGGRYMEMPMFITTDSVYHVYHLIFDKMLRDLETTYFTTAIKTLTTEMLSATSTQYQSLKGGSLADPALRNVAYFAVADRLLGLTDPYPQEADSLAQAELSLINSAAGPEISPIWDRPDLSQDMRLIEDYSQYIPRGHYTLSEDLKKYFKAMMWYGRLTFRQADDFETQRALLVVQALRSASSSGTSAVSTWDNIYEPTVFIVGKSDDLGYIEYGALSDQVFGTNPDPAKFADPALFAQFQQAAKNLPPPQVNSMWVWIEQDKALVTKGFRFMGQRFTLDEYVFGQVIWRNVGTMEKPRGLPKGLDFFAALGSDEAYTLLKAAGAGDYANYDTQMTKVKGEVAALGTDSWTQNLYWSWLYSFQPLIEPKGAAFPPFMQTQAWTRKDLQTALGSWTELKHDTILYAKQVMAEMGGGGPDQPPHGYVEPNPEAYARLLALTQMTLDGLKSRNLLSDLTNTNLSNLIEELTFLKRISESELAGTTISNDDYWHIQYWGGTLEQFTLAASDRTDPTQRDLSDQKAALVADVATGTNDLQTLVVLEEGEGQPTRIYVILPDNPVRVALGAVYTYYEFTVPASGRLNDQTWQSQVESGTNPAQPDWTSMFIAP